MAASEMSFISNSSPQFGGYRRRHSSIKVYMAETKTKPSCSPNNSRTRTPHAMPPEKIEVFNSLEPWARANILPLLKPVEKCWQPQDFLPNPSSTTTGEQFYDQVRAIQLQAREIPDDYLVCLIGNMITEEALPTYQTMLNTMEGVKDETGASTASWAVWSRRWTAEENRHGDLLNKYLYLTGRVDMRMVEKTIQYLISNGMAVGLEHNPYHGFIYTSFQERATFISHSNTARHAKKYGDLKLAQICGIIASDEKRHEAAYTRIVGKLFEVDPDITVQALATMMKHKVTMPAHLMHDGRDNDLFNNYSAVAQRLGIYTVKDYADILEFLVERWKVGDLIEGLSGEGRKAQDYVCELAIRMRKVEERARNYYRKGKERKSRQFSWVYGREVVL